MCAVNKYFVRYEKLDRAKYISHLDFLRTIGRAMRRAGLPVKYTEGFNPHPVLSFAAPLSVGITSGCELFSTELLHKIPCDEFKTRLNGALPPSIRISRVTETPIDFNTIAWADYEVTPENAPSDEYIKLFLQEDEIIIDKKTKKGIKKTNIRKNIKEMSLEGGKILMTLSAGNNASLKPMLAMDALKNFCKVDLGFCYYHRAAFRDVYGEVI